MKQIAVIAIAFFLLALVECAIDCNERGIAEADSPNACECFQCYQGLNCESEIANCTVGAGDGDPLIFEQYYLNHPIDGEVTIPSDYRTPYEGGYPEEFAFHINPVLVDLLKALHRQINNAETEGYTFVAGAGCTQLLGAAMYALSQQPSNSSTTTVSSVFVQTPYYMGYPGIANTLIKGVNFNASYQQDPRAVIEIVTYPNNPTFNWRTPYYATANVVHDMVYDWPSYVDVQEKRADAIMLFSFSKLFGLAGSRLGWALVKDVAVAQRMAEFISLESIGVSVDAQFRAIEMLRYELTANLPVIDYVRAALQLRWSEMTRLWNGYSQTSFVQLNPSGAYYMWIQCNIADNCNDRFVAAGMQCEDGAKFGQPQHMRVNMMIRDAAFGRLLHAMDALLSKA
eukprot:TRINITY_DN880_c0_g1_i1.p1 TRINITY_DN880_c0_g1~~TRINITY_DN880_c0_g1_i1.p1  ORF type:complete len:399 (-),score=86.01 TRINITY_DN880_c0_g1_i1:153-1349(-)